MKAWLTIVGVTEAGLADLSREALQAIGTAGLIVGAERHLRLLGGDVRAERLAWTRPLSATIEAIERRRGEPVCVLATGDPLCYGVGATLARAFGPEEMRVFPAPGAFAFLTARMGWPAQEVVLVSLHGRPLEILAGVLSPGARIAVLSEDGSTPAKVATALAGWGWGPSAMTVFEALGGPHERRIEGHAADWSAFEVAALNCIAIQCRAGAATTILSTAPGMPDEAYAHDGQITKREVRAATLAALEPLPFQHLWDIGAGAGSIAIEWMRAARLARASAVERDPLRLAEIRANALRLGVPGLKIVAGVAPQALAELEPPNAVFIGGGLEAPLLAQAWQALPSGGRLVANAVTAESEAVLLAARAELDAELVRIAVQRLERVGARHGWRPLMPVTQLRARKP
jgi:precorrin-6B C5,15-methyltransferase / cobalt-precorrin-6B C5,C15-methyltransferase